MGRGDIFIYSCLQTCMPQPISKEINCAEHKYINMRPPPIIEFATPLRVLIQSMHGCADKFYNV